MLCDSDIIALIVVIIILAMVMIMYVPRYPSTHQKGTHQSMWTKSIPNKVFLVPPNPELEDVEKGSHSLS